MFKSSVGKLYSLILACKPEDSRISKRILIAEIISDDSYTRLVNNVLCIPMVSRYYNPYVLESCSIEQLSNIKQIISFFPDLAERIFKIIKNGDARILGNMIHIDFYSHEDLKNLYDYLGEQSLESENITNIKDDNIWVIFNDETILNCSSIIDVKDVSDKPLVDLLNNSGCSYCITQAELFEIEHEREKKLARKKIIIKISAIFIGILVIIGIILAKYVIVPLYNTNQAYNDGKVFYQNKDYDSAYDAFSKIYAYKDSSEYMNKSLYEKGRQLLIKGEYKEAIEIFTKLDDYSNSKDRVTEAYYLLALKYQEDKNYQDAISVYEKIIDYKEALKLRNTCIEKYAQTYITSKDYDKAEELYKVIGDDKLIADLNAIRTEDVRSSALTDINATDKENVYREAEQQKYDEYKQEYIEKIIAAESIDQINGYLKDYRNAISRIKTDAQYKNEEAAKKRKEAAEKAAIEKAEQEAKEKAEREAREAEERAREASEKAIAEAKRKEEEKKAYEWVVTSCCVNTSSQDYSTDMPSISKYNTFYAHFTVKRGAGGDGSFMLKTYYPDGQVNYSYVSAPSGNTINMDSRYNNPNDVSSGYITIELYDFGDNLLYSKTFYSE